MALLNERDRQALRAELAQLTNMVRLVFFTQALECETCGITQQILAEVVPLSPKLELKIYNYALDHDAVNQYNIARIPAIAVVRLETRGNGTDAAQPVERDYGIRFYGVPSGYEFMALLGAILDVSRGESGLSPESKVLLAQLQAPTHFQVFTTPT